MHLFKIIEFKQLNSKAAVEDSQGCMCKMCVLNKPNGLSAPRIFIGVWPLDSDLLFYNAMGL